MNKNHPILLMVTFFSFTSLYFALPPGGSASYIQSKNVATCQNNSAINQSFWQWIKCLFINKKDETIPKGEKQLCLIAPNIKAWRSFSRRPIFVWGGEGIVQRITVFDAATGTSIWSYDFDSAYKKQSIQYGINKGMPPTKVLEIGKYYTYVFSYQGENGQAIDTKPNNIFVLDKDRNSIEQELVKINKQYPKSPPDKAQKRSEFFFNYGSGELFSDGVRELFSLELPSPDWDNQLKKLREDFCSKQES